MMTPNVALFAALRAEYAAVYLYGLIGGRASRGGKPAEIARWNALYSAHQLRRDQLITFLTADGVPLPSPAVAYAAPIDPVSAATRAACAREIEIGCERIYARVVSATTGTQRAFGMKALTAVSTAAATLGQTPSAFPGLEL